MHKQAAFLNEFLYCSVHFTTCVQGGHIHIPIACVALPRTAEPFMHLVKFGVVVHCLCVLCVCFARDSPCVKMTFYSILFSPDSTTK
jgi:hypothetical protein